MRSEKTPERVFDYGRRHPKCEVCGDSTVWVHHKWPKSHPEGYEGDIHGDENLCAVCARCHGLWGSARYVGDQPNPRGNVSAYRAGYRRLVEDMPGRRWDLMAPSFILARSVSQ